MPLKPITRGLFEQTIDKMLNNQFLAVVDGYLQSLRNDGLIGTFSKRDMMIVSVIYYLDGGFITQSGFVEPDMSIDEYREEITSIIRSRALRYETPC